MNAADFAERIEAAKERLPILELLERLNVPTKKKGAFYFCSCPAHREKTESCRVGGSTGAAWNCFGCGAAGDQIHFIEAALGFSRSEAIRHFFRMTGFADNDNTPLPPAARVEPPRRSIERKSRPDLPPALTTGSCDKYIKLARLRGVSYDAVDAMVRAGMLFFCEIERAGTCWLITDRERINAQTRRLDGQPIFGVKSHTLAGSWAKWPIGISSAGKDVLFVEGGPDLLAAFEIKVKDSQLWSPVGMFGGAMEIHSAALPLFARKNVRIVPHNDGGKGDASAEAWRDQLLPVAGKVTVAKIPGSAKDLNDYVRLASRAKLLP